MKLPPSWAGRVISRPVQIWRAQAARIITSASILRSVTLRCNILNRKEPPMTEQEASGWTGTIGGQPTIGQVAQRRRKTSPDDVVRFTEITGDRNPLHYDEAVAAKTAVGGVIVQGGVTSGLLNALVAEDLPGPGTVFLEVQWRFVKAVRIGDEIVDRARVMKVRTDKPICTLETSIENAAGDVCLTGTAVTYTFPLD